MTWHYAEGDHQVGPITEEEFVSLARSGRIDDETLVWKAGMADWQPFRTVKRELGSAPDRQTASSSPAELIPVGDGGGSREETFAPGGAAADGMVYGGFWIRFVAAMLDGIILTIVSMAIGIPLALRMAEYDSTVVDAVNSLIQMLVGAAFVTFFLGKYGATPGKMALGLKVVRSNGAEITYARAFARYWAEYLSFFTLLIGYIIAAFDSQKRALHDHICDTRVIRD